eukprot:COSAG02_NODE_3718_length_6328_cov_3.336009_2_plen_125_part_00
MLWLLSVVAIELRVMYDAVLKHVPKMRKHVVPRFPSDSGRSTDARIIEQRQRWIAKFFPETFKLLDERMRRRDHTVCSNEWETSFARDMCVPHRLALVTMYRPLDARGHINADVICRPYVVGQT